MFNLNMDLIILICQIILMLNLLVILFNLLINLLMYSSFSQEYVKWSSAVERSSNSQQVGTERKSFATKFSEICVSIFLVKTVNFLIKVGRDHFTAIDPRLSCFFYIVLVSLNTIALGTYFVSLIYHFLKVLWVLYPL